MTSVRYICKNRIFALVWRVAIVALCAVGLYPMFFGASFSSQSLCYFTTQSNIFIGIMFSVLTVGTILQIIGNGVRGEVYHIAVWLQLAVVFFIQITFLVFALMLSGSTFAMGYEIGISNILLHYVVPLMSLADWILFMPHGEVKYKHAAIWLTYPAAYVAFAFIRAYLGKPFYGGSRFPYFFMDADVLGFNLFWICPLFFAVFFILGCLLVFADRLLSGNKRIQKSKEILKV